MLTLDHSERYRLMHLLLDVGEAMLRAGSEVNRVEDTLTRMGTAYGASDINVFAITSSIVLTLRFPDDHDLTQTRRIHTEGGTNFLCLEKMNALSRRCCSGEPLPLPVLEQEIRTATVTVPLWEVILGSALAAGAFAVFFGGSAADGLSAAVFGLLICLLQYRLTPFLPNKMTFNLLCSLLIGLLICLSAHFAPFLNADKIIIGEIMLLIPGIAMTNSIRDILVGDTISGILRLTESILWAAGLAAGTMLALWLTGGAAL